MLGVDFHFENIIYKYIYYLFCAVHFLFFVVFFLKLKFSSFGGVVTVETNEGHSQLLKNHRLPSLGFWRCMWLSAFDWAFVCTQQRVIWNYFWQRRSDFDCLFFLWYWNKQTKKKNITLFCFGSAVPNFFQLTCGKRVLLWNQHIVVYMKLLLHVVWTKQNQKRTGSRSQSALMLEPEDAGRQGKLWKAGTFWGSAKTCGVFVQPDVQRSRRLPAPNSCSCQTDWETKKKKKKLLLDTNTVTF